MLLLYDNNQCTQFFDNPIPADNNELSRPRRNGKRLFADLTSEIHSSYAYIGNCTLSGRVVIILSPFKSDWIFLNFPKIQKAKRCCQTHRGHCAEGGISNRSKKAKSSGSTAKEFLQFWQIFVSFSLVILYSSCIHRIYYYLYHNCDIIVVIN